MEYITLVSVKHASAMCWRHREIQSRLWIKFFLVNRSLTWKRLIFLQRYHKNVGHYLTNILPSQKDVNRFLRIITIHQNVRTKSPVHLILLIKKRTQYHNSNCGVFFITILIFWIEKATYRTHAIMGSRHYKPRLVYFSTHFKRPFLSF